MWSRNIALYEFGLATDPIVESYKVSTNLLQVSFEVSTAADRCCPKSSAKPITVTPIWKREFANGKHPIGGLYRIFFEVSFFKFPFSHERFQMGQKMCTYQLYKL